MLRNFARPLSSNARAFGPRTPPRPGLAASVSAAHLGKRAGIEPQLYVSASNPTPLRTSASRGGLGSASGSRSGLADAPMLAQGRLRPQSAKGLGRSASAAALTTAAKLAWESGD